MSRKILPIVALVAFLVGISLHADPPKTTPVNSDNALQKQIAGLIEQLGSGEFEERKAAQEGLLNIGEDAREALENALKNPDPEVAAAAATVLKQMDMLRLVFVCTDEKGALLKDKTLTINITSTIPYNPDRPYTEPEKVEKSGKIAENGTFSLEPFHGKDVTISAKIEGLVPIMSNQLRFQGGKYVIPLRFVLASTIKGVVVDADNKDVPVPDALVTVAIIAGGVNQAITDEKGRFEIKGIPPGSHQVSVRKEQMEQETRLQTINVASGKTSEVKIRMVRRDETGKGKSFKCKMLTPDGKPLANTQVFIDTEIRQGNTTYPLRYGGQPKGKIPTTDAEGNLSLDRFEQSGLVTMKIYVRGYKPVELEEHEVKPGESWEIKEPIKLDKGLEIEVVVKDAAGKPVADAKVITRAVEDGSMHYSRYELFGHDDPRRAMPPWASPMQEKLANPPGVTDDKGTAKADGLPEGDIAVVAVKDGYVVSGQKTVTLKKGEVAKIEITLEKEATADVKIIDADTEEPVPGAHARVVGKSEGGRVIHVDMSERTYAKPGSGQPIQKIRNIPAGKVTISASASAAEGYHESTVEEEFKPGESKSITIKMKPLRDGTLAGTIKPAASMPMSEVFCALLYRSGYPLRFGYGGTPIVLRLDKKGRFRMPKIQEGEWGITVLDMNDRPIILQKDFKVEPGKTTEVTLQLQALGSLEIELVDHEGKPLAGAQPDLIGFGSPAHFMPTQLKKFFYLEWGSGFVTTDEEGKCKFENLLPGVYRLFKRRPSSQYLVMMVQVPLMGKVTVKADKTEKVKFRVPKTTSIEGTLTARHDRLCNVIVFRQAATFLGMFIMPVGRKDGVKPGEKFKVEGIPPGKYIIAATARGDDMIVSTYTTEIEVKEGVPVKGIELKFPEKTQKISGKLKDYKGKPSPALDEVIIFYGPALAGAKINPDGTFETQAPPGEYKVYRINIYNVMKGEQPAPKPIEITIEEGKDLTGVEIP